MKTTESVFDLYKLKDFIDPKRIHWWKLVTKENTIPFIEKYIEFLDKECLEKLSKNPFAVEMLKRNISKISWNDFVNNPNAIHVIDDYFDICISELNSYGKINLIRHPNFVYIIKKHFDKIIDKFLCNSCLPVLASIKSTIFIELIEKYFTKYPEKKPSKNASYFWNVLCGNPYAIHLIENNLDRLNNNSWNLLAKNTNAIGLLNGNLHKLDKEGWFNLSANSNAIAILEENKEKIDWYNLCNNVSGYLILEKYPEKIMTYSFFDYDYLSVSVPIFELDYDVINKRCSIYKDELLAVALQPWRIEEYINQGIMLGNLDNYI